MHDMIVYLLISSITNTAQHTTVPDRYLAVYVSEAECLRALHESPPPAGYVENGTCMPMPLITKGSKR